MKFPEGGGRGTGTGRDPRGDSHHLAQPLELGLHHWLLSVPALRDILTGEEDHKEADQGEEPEDHVLSQALLELRESCLDSHQLQISESHRQPAHHNSHLKQIISSFILHQDTIAKVHPTNKQYPVNYALLFLRTLGYSH